MSNSSTDAIVELLKKAIAARKENTASVAQRSGMDRKDLKRMLSGSIPLTVDAMLRLGEALELDAAFLQSLGFDTPELDQGSQAVQILETDEWSVDPYGNQSEQLIRLGFALGLTFIIYLKTEKLSDSGVPITILSHYSPRLPIRIEPEFHVHNQPQYDQFGFQLRLSFDAVYTCQFPWDSVIQISFIPESEPQPEPDSNPPTKAGGHLRIVK